LQLQKINDEDFIYQPVNYNLFQRHGKNITVTFFALYRSLAPSKQLFL